MTGLRADLELRNADGGPLVFDPLRQRYFRTDAAALDALVETGDGGRARRDELLRVATMEESAALARAARARRSGWRGFLMHRYLFLRIPLFRPDAFLDATLPLVRPLMSRAVGLAFAVAGLFALLVVARRPDLVAGSFASLMTLDGALAYLAALAVVKALHELGHAYALKRRGGAVPTIGIAFVVLFPILYTDTTDAWLLPRRERLTVDLAGIVVELGVAVVATWLWLVLPEGGARDVAFALASVSWVMSLAVNLNPFMRFDGYHVLADATGIANLQERSFALARWRLREALFAPGEAPPEHFARGSRRALVLYAFVTWGYRLVLFTGIAIFVYQATFKVLGVVLFLVEMAHFVVRPVWREVRRWPRCVSAARMRSLVPMGIGGLLLVLLALPLDRSVNVPAVLEAGRVSVLRAPVSGRIVALDEERGVARGQVVARLARPERVFEGRRIEARRAALAGRSVHGAGGAAPTRDAELALVVRSRRRWIARTLHETMVAPASGRIAFEPGMAAGLHVARGDVVATLVAPGDRVVALAHEAVLHRLPEQASGTFRADENGRAIPVATVRRGMHPVAAIDPPELAAAHGGPIAGVGNGDRPARPHFALRFAVDAHPLPPGRWRGVVTLPAAPRSYGGLFLERAWALAVRESGF